MQHEIKCGKWRNAITTPELAQLVTPTFKRHTEIWRVNIFPNMPQSSLILSWKIKDVHHVSSIIVVYIYWCKYWEFQFCFTLGETSKKNQLICLCTGRQACVCSNRRDLTSFPLLFSIASYPPPHCPAPPHSHAFPACLRRQRGRSGGVDLTLRPPGDADHYCTSLLSHMSQLRLK